LVISVSNSGMFRNLLWKLAWGILLILNLFVLSAVVGTIIENTQKDAILADALSVENGAKLYCAQTTCASDEELTWTMVSPYVEGLDESYYLLTNNGGVVATKTTAGWTVDLEAIAVAGDAWEFTQDAIPSNSTRDQVIADLD